MRRGTEGMVTVLTPTIQHRRWYDQASRRDCGRIRNLPGRVRRAGPSCPKAGPTGPIPRGRTSSPRRSGLIMRLAITRLRSAWRSVRAAQCQRSFRAALSSASMGKTLSGGSRPRAPWTRRTHSNVARRRLVTQPAGSPRVRERSMKRPAVGHVQRGAGGERGSFR